MGAKWKIDTTRRLKNLKKREGQAARLPNRGRGSQLLSKMQKLHSHPRAAGSAAGSVRQSSQSDRRVKPRGPLRAAQELGKMPTTTIVVPPRRSAPKAGRPGMKRVKAESARLPRASSEHPTRAERAMPRALPIVKRDRGHSRGLIAPKATARLTSAIPPPVALGPAGPGLCLTHAERRHAKAVQRAERLLSELSPFAIELALGGAQAASQLPDAAARHRLLLQAILHKGGPEGQTTDKARRAWRLLAARAAEDSLPDDALPASAAIVASVVGAELERAQLSGRGSQGGRTVGRCILDGFEMLRKIGLPIGTTDLMVEAAAAPRGPALARPRRHAGSMPLGIQCQLELTASLSDPSPQRLLARCLLVSCILHNTRLNDALNATVFEDEVNPDGVVRGRTAVASKDGLPLELYAPAEGWLGPITWLKEHLADTRHWAYAIPAYKSRPRNCPSAAGTIILQGVASRAQARGALLDICAQAPLRMSADEFKALNITTHSPHTTGSDMMRVMGANKLPTPEAPFNESHFRAMGHWLRDRNAPQADPRKAGAPRRGQADGVGNARGGMELRYTQGHGRRGERAEQIEVRSAFNKVVYDALRRLPDGWASLPKTTESWDALLPTEA